MGNNAFSYGVSDNDIGNGGSYTNYYVTNVYEVVQEKEVPNIWETNISDFGTTDFLLFMIFILLLVQFLHKLFKGSHWFRW